jgi:hypothetical protein
MTGLAQLRVHKFAEDQKTQNQTTRAILFVTLEILPRSPV